MGSIVDTVGVGKTYTTLATWIADVGSDADDVHSAECYSSGDLGPVTVFPAWTTSAEEPCDIYAAAGHERLAYIDLTGFDAIFYHCAFGAIRDLRINAVGAFTAPIQLGQQSAGLQIVERNLIVYSGVGSMTGVSLITERDGHIATIRNNMVWAADATGESAIYMVVIGAGISNVIAYIYNNSGRVSGVSGYGGLIWFGAGSADNTAIRRNNIIVSDFFKTGSGYLAFKTVDDGVDNSVDASYDVSCDNSADDDGGIGHTMGVTEAQVWADITDNDEPFALTADGACDPADGANLYDEGMTIDGVGQPRPDPGPFGNQYRGAVTLYIFYGFPVPVDYVIETVHPALPIDCSYRLVSSPSYTVRLYAGSPPVLYDEEIVSAVDMDSPSVVFTGVANGTYLVTVEADYGGFAELIQSKWFYILVDSAESEQAVVVVPGPDEVAGPLAFVVTLGRDSQGAYLEWDYPASADDLDFHLWFESVDPGSDLIVPAEAADFIMPGFLGQSYYKFYLYDNRPWIIIAAKKNDIWSDPLAIYVGTVTLTQRMQPHPED